MKAPALHYAYQASRLSQEHSESVTPKIANKKQSNNGASKFNNINKVVVTHSKGGAIQHSASKEALNHDMREVFS